MVARISVWFGLTASVAAFSPVIAQDAVSLAKAFGAREGVQQMSLSPDGTKVALIVPSGARGDALRVADTVKGGAPLTIFRADGAPDRLRTCRWVTDARLVCTVQLLTMINAVPALYTRSIAIGADGQDLKVLSAAAAIGTLGLVQDGGTVVDWTGGKPGNVLMTHLHKPEFSLGNRGASSAEGLGVDRIDTASLVRSEVEPARRDASAYLTDGQGAVRIMTIQRTDTDGYELNRYDYLYRAAGSRSWQPLGSTTIDKIGTLHGFEPLAVDRDHDLAYGFDLHAGLQALFSVSLDAAKRRELVLARPEVDVDGLVRIGRQHRVIGASYAEERRQVDYFDPELKALHAALAKALPDTPMIAVVDASADERKVLIHAGSDVDPGSYYLLDRTTKQMAKLTPVRPALAGITLAHMTPVRFPAADGTIIPGYLTLPPGSNGKDLAAIVMPHGGPGARDEWGFDWWAQLFAARGFAVLQPNFRGSSGYGSAWFQKNGFQSWRIAIGDINDAGKWLIAQHIAAPGKLAIVGWSYGGYAALQSAVLGPALFKAIIAVAPVTDLGSLKEESLPYSTHELVDAYVGNGPHTLQGSPARNAAAFQVPVLLFHGTEDRTVSIAESRLMADRLRSAGKTVDLTEYRGLDHGLEDSEARADMLAKSDAFLRTALGMNR
jgi:dipeptidyl aminopeptidase/acylaminoacyl peptidase